MPPRPKTPHPSHPLASRPLYTQHRSRAFRRFDRAQNFPNILSDTPLSLLLPLHHAIIEYKKDVIPLKTELNTPVGTCSFVLPDVCPYCCNGMQPSVHVASPSVEGNEFAIILSCPICKKLFFSVYSIHREYDNKLYSSNIAVHPYQQSKPQIPREIKQYYPYFFQIYEQAAIAEKHGLNKITGMAYRKALEVLVKQYMINQFPDDENNILNEPLGHSIARISSAKIHSLAKAISWIGNDQTHMVQKHPDYNVPEMKRFMLALCHLVIAEHIADDAVSFISS